MNQQRLNAYLNLIQGLLNCPHGEEWTLLQQHEELVNPELTQVIEQVANQLAAEGKLQAAEFLHHWGEQLRHVLAQAGNGESKDEKSEAYLQLIQALLDCPKGSEADILAANQGLIDWKLVQLIKQVANQIAAQGNRNAARYLTNLAVDLSRSLMPSRALKTQLEQNIKPPNFTTENQLQAPPPLDDKAEIARSSPQLETVSNQQLDNGLAAIGESLAKLEQILISRLQPPDPLWYMNILERAQASEWILTTEEVEQLIGVKPQSKAGENFYQRGCWIFVKAGKMGSQTGWHVKKNREKTNTLHE
ncbi:MAG: hypothetical protein VKL59_06350 [Nostocaceae cyanobacterium]|nr:hypothetical protein [Nostocaceae cyanobacterium]